MAKTSIETINNAKFDFGIVPTTETETRGELGKIEVWKRTYTDSKGESHVLELTNKACVTSATRLEVLLSMREKSSLGICYEMSVLAENKAKFGFKTAGEIGQVFNLKSSTASAYARVGHYFVNLVETGNGINYELKPEFKGASVANLVQVLSLVDDKAENPLEELISAMRDDRLDIGGTLANVKKQLKAIKTGAELDDNGNAIIDTTAKEVSSIKENIAESFSVLLSECEKLTDDKKELALSHIVALQEIFDNLKVEIAD